MKTPEPLRIVLATVGSRGDVQPMLALALELQARGHHPVLAAPPDFAAWAQSLGIAFAPLGLRSMFNGGGAVAAFELGTVESEGSDGGSQRARARVGVVGAAPFSSFCSAKPSSVRGKERGENGSLEEEDLEWRWDERCGELMVSPPSSSGGEAATVGDWSFEVFF